MRFELQNLIFWKTKRAFEKKQKTYFFVSQLLSFRLKKQTSENVVNTTFNTTYFEKHLQTTVF